MLVFVHVPKTAGTSFVQTLLDLGLGDAIRDYNDCPIHRNRVMVKVNALLFAKKFKPVPEAEILYGHFLARKYHSLKGRRLVTWLRNPVQRLVSHYDYWQREYDPATACPLHRRMIEECWDFQRFALGAELRNLQSYFLWGVPLKDFDFVGVTENYSQDLRKFGVRFNAHIKSSCQLNIRPDSPNPLSTAMRKRIEQWHAKDMRLYSQAIQLGRSGYWGESLNA